jgi:hypothetical protein
LETIEKSSEIHEKFEMCWRRMEIIWTDRVKNEVLHRVKEERSILHAIKKKEKSNYVDYILSRSGLLKHSIEGHIEGKIEGTGRR